MNEEAEEEEAEQQQKILFAFRCRVATHQEEKTEETVFLLRLPLFLSVCVPVSNGVVKKGWQSEKNELTLEITK